MIQKNSSNSPVFRETTLIISQDNPGEFKFRTGTVSGFVPEKTVLVSDKNPALVWDLFRELTGLPLPEAGRKSVAPSVSCPMFDGLPATAIVDKVFKETGVRITNCLKSKKAIIAKALKIYEKSGTPLN